MVRAHPTIKWRHIITMTEKVEGKEMMNFSNGLTDNLQKMGIHDAELALEEYRIRMIELEEEEDDMQCGMFGCTNEWLNSFLSQFRYLSDP